MIRAIIMFALALTLASAAFAEPKLPVGVTCEQVRDQVAEYGKIAAYAWARLQGYSARQIAEARKCLR